MPDGSTTPRRAPRDPAARRRSRAVAAWARIARLYAQTVRNVGEVLRPFGLSSAEFDVLAQLGPAEGICQRELARRLLVTQGNVTYHVRRLEARGLLERRHAGRRKHLYLTKAGRTALAAALPEVERWHEQQFAPLEPEAIHALLRALRRLDRGEPAAPTVLAEPERAGRARDHRPDSQEDPKA